jgi:hypothetical protein
MQKQSVNMKEKRHLKIQEADIEVAVEWFLKQMEREEMYWLQVFRSCGVLL